MADLNFPKDRTELVPPGTGALQTGDTYTANGTTWVYDADAGAWGSGTGAISETIYLSRVNDDTAEGAITFQGETTHEGGVRVTGGSLPTNSSSGFYATEGATNTTLSAYATYDGTGLPRIIWTTSGKRLGLMGGADGKAYVHVNGDMSVEGTEPNNYALWSFPNSVDTTRSGDIHLISSRFPGNTKGSLGKVIHYSNHNTDTSISDVYGFRSEIATGAAANRYNFYAEGNAPNFFRGNVNTNGELSVRTESASGDFPGAGNTNTGFRAQPSGVGAFSANHANATSFVTLFNRSNFNGTLLSFRKNGNENGSIFIDDSNITIIGQTSDYRVKTNIQPFASSVDKVKAINVVNFEYTDRAPGVIQEGFVAHELAEICPKAVVGTKDATEAIGTLTDVNGVVTTDVTEPEEIPYGETWVQTGTRPVYQGVDQTKLIPLLTKALQEALDKIETLETRLSDAGIA